MSTSISISKSNNEVSINGFQDGFAITPYAKSATYIAAAPDDSYSFLTSPVEVYSITNTTSGFEVGEFNLSNAINVTLGTLPCSPTIKDLNGFKYSFDEFNLANPENFTAGDIVYFKHQEGVNNYNSSLQKANVANSDGAYSNLMLFIKYQNGKLYLLHKGFFDYEQDSTYINDWVPGRTIYLNSQNKISQTPADISGEWVKSLGMCMPNKENKKRIWFDADTTYLKIR
jgi:hypothetical protein